MTLEDRAALGRTARLVALLNLAYFSVEFAVALRIGAVSLLADSVDFLEDAAVNLLILAVLRLGARSRARVGMGLAALLLIPAAAFLLTLWRKLHGGAPPAPAPLGVTALGALGVNLTCAVLLARRRRAGGSLARAAFLSARNDALANLAIITASAVTLLWSAIWPDVVVGCAIALLNLEAAREVLAEARREDRAAAGGDR